MEHKHKLRLQLVVGHPVRIFGCAGFCLECEHEGCNYRALSTIAEMEKMKEGFCGTAIQVLKRGYCTCGRATDEEISAERAETEQNARQLGWDG